MTNINTDIKLFKKDIERIVIQKINGDINLKLVVFQHKIKNKYAKKSKLILLDKISNKLLNWNGEKIEMSTKDILINGKKNETISNTEKTFLSEYDFVFENEKKCFSQLINIIYKLEK